MMEFLCVSLFFIFFGSVQCWTTEDLELFDLVENTPQTFYDVLGVDEKASASEIKKAYRRLSTLYHPDKSKHTNAEEIFRGIAAVADVLRNEERRKTYDVILKMGLPDWREPVYYYRRVRNTGLFELAIFLFSLATFAQYLYAWSAYWEKKYEIEETVLSKIRKKAKHQRRGKNAKIDEATVNEVMASLPKPRWQDLLPVRLYCFFVHFIKSSPPYMASCRNYFKLRKSAVEEEKEEEKREIRMKCRKQIRPKIPDYSSNESYNVSNGAGTIGNGVQNEKNKPMKKIWSLNSLTEQQVLELKKALKKFPNGTLQRWEKVATYLDCSVHEVAVMVKEMKNQDFSKSVLVSMQGVTGTEKENFGVELYEEKGLNIKATQNKITSNGTLSQNNDVIGNCSKRSPSCDTSNAVSEKIWKHEEQRVLEFALQKFPKDTSGRWDKIADYVSTKTKEECMERYKILAQQVKKKKGNNM